MSTRKNNLASLAMLFLNLRLSLFKSRYSLVRAVMNSFPLRGGLKNPRRIVFPTLA